MSFTGVPSNLLESCLFIRTRRSLAPDSVLDIELVIPDGKVSFLKGIVKRTVRTTISSIKNGMGIELIEKDSTYIDFFKTIAQELEKILGDKTTTEFQIISYAHCKA